MALSLVPLVLACLALVVVCSYEARDRRRAGALIDGETNHAEASSSSSYSLLCATATTIDESPREEAVVPMTDAEIFVYWGRSP